jgi:hypothetical protein
MAAGARGRAEVEAELRSTLGNAYMEVNLFDDAEPRSRARTT